MNIFKKMYRDFFGLTEQTSFGKKPDPTKDVVLSADDTKDPKKVLAAQNVLKTTKGRLHIEDGLDPVGKEDSDINNDGTVDNSDEYLKKRRKAISKNIEEEIVDEAQLLNKITDYRGGVEFVLFDPATAENVFDEIKQFAAKKKIYVIKSKLSPSGKVGYFQFRLGEDPAKESQQIQGYISQKPEIKHFRFNVRGQKPKVAPEPQI
jgi:hypothetical protein